MSLRSIFFPGFFSVSSKRTGFGLAVHLGFVFFPGEKVTPRLRRVIRESEVGCAFAWERILSVLKRFLCFRDTKLDSHVGCFPTVLQFF